MIIITINVFGLTLILNSASDFNYQPDDTVISVIIIV